MKELRDAIAKIAAAAPGTPDAAALLPVLRAIEDELAAIRIAVAIAIRKSGAGGPEMTYEIEHLNSGNPKIPHGTSTKIRDKVFEIAHNRDQPIEL